MTLQRTVNRNGFVRLRGYCRASRKRVTVICGLDGDAVTARREGRVHAEYAATGRIVQPEREAFVPMKVETMVEELGLAGGLRKWLIECRRHEVVTAADAAWLDEFAAYSCQRGMSRQRFVAYHRELMVAFRRMAAAGVLPMASYNRMSLWSVPALNWAPVMPNSRYTPPMADIWAVVDACGEPLRSFLAVLACSGMRRADAARIIGQWVEPVEPGLVRVVLRRHKTADTVGAITIMVWGRGAEILSRLALASPDKPVWPHHTMPSSHGAGRPSTQVWSKQRIDYQIRRVCEQHGVRQFTTHGIRRAVAKSIRDKHGLETARIIMGHKSATITAAHYAEHDSQAALVAARSAM